MRKSLDKQYRDTCICQWKLHVYLYLTMKKYIGNIVCLTNKLTVNWLAILVGQVLVSITGQVISRRTQLSAMQTIHMKYQTLFSISDNSHEILSYFLWKKYFNVSSAAVAVSA